MIKIISTTFLALTLSQSVLAEDAKHIVSFDLNKFYAGAGFSHNRIDTSSVFGGSDGSASGMQVFAGYEYGNRNGFDISTEAGLIQTDEFFTSGEDANGIWVAGVVSKDLPEIDDKLSAIVRLGYGVNGDDGLLMGFGAQYRVLPQAFVRLEYLNKDLTQSYQANAIYKF